MSNYLTLGAIRIRISSRLLAPWGYARLVIGGLSLWSRCNDGSLMLASYHPNYSPTWFWAIGCRRARGQRQWIARARIRRGQWHDYYRLPFGWEVRFSRQSYHQKNDAIRRNDDRTVAGTPAPLS